MYRIVWIPKTVFTLRFHLLCIYSRKQKKGITSLLQHRTWVWHRARHLTSKSTEYQTHENTHTHSHTRINYMKRWLWEQDPLNTAAWLFPGWVSVFQWLDTNRNRQQYPWINPPIMHLSCSCPLALMTFAFGSESYMWILIEEKHWPISIDVM